MADRRSELDELLDDATTNPAKHSRRSRRKPKKRKTLRNWLIVIGSLLALIAIGLGVAYAMVSASYNEIERVDVIDPNLLRPEPITVSPDENAPINILLLGSDLRGTTDRTASGEDLRGFRSDAIMVAQISPNREHVTVMSIMRDNWVPIQGHGEAKINSAVSYGGLPLAVNTVETFINSRIDHVALIDFESFKGLTDAVGGVTINNPTAFTNINGGSYSFEAGEITLNGDQALAFVRERYAFSDGDYQRARNQQIYIKGLLGQILSKDTLTSPSKVTGLFESITPYLIVDKGLDLNTAVGLGLELKDFKKENITFFTSPTLGTGRSDNGQSIVRPDWDEIENMRTAMRDGTLNEYAETRAAGSELPGN